MGVVDKAKQVAKLGGAAVTAWNLVVSIEGAPVRRRDEPAKVKLAGLPVFMRDENGERFLFGIPLGKRKR